MMGRFAGRPILISGAGRGLGEGIAKHLASEGAVVGVVDLDGDTARGVAEAISDAGGKAHAYQADCGKRQAFFDVAEQFARDAGPLRAVINNASLLVYEPIEAVTEETLDRMLSAGLKSVFWGRESLFGYALIQQPVRRREWPIALARHRVVRLRSQADVEQWLAGVLR